MTTGGAAETERVDKWVWAVRLAKTRRVAADACKGGHVDVNGKTAKPSTTVTIGDHVVVRLHDEVRTVEVRELIGKRVGAPRAAECLVDHTPPQLPRPERTPPIAVRDPGAGRPTKRERRQLEDWRRQNR